MHLLKHPTCEKDVEQLVAHRCEMKLVNEAIGGKGTKGKRMEARGEIFIFKNEKTQAPVLRNLRVKYGNG